MVVAVHHRRERQDRNRQDKRHPKPLAIIGDHGLVIMAAGARAMTALMAVMLMAGVFFVSVSRFLFSAFLC